ncbi:MAG TPA: hypothetical protein VIS74_07710 [Chthoniobacterales bacterium]
MHRKSILGLGVLSLLAGMILAGCGRPPEETPDVTILQTGRIRGNAYPLTLKGISPLQHYPYLAGYVKKVRQEAQKNGAEVLLVDLGDSLEGSFASYATGGANMAAFFNALDYDAIVLGNLDNNVQPELLSQLKARVLNPFQDAAGQPATQGTQFAASLNKGGIPIYLLANFYGNVSEREFPERFPTWFGTTAAQVQPVRDYEAVLAALGPRAAGGLTLFSWMKFEPPGQPPQAFLDELTRLGVNAILAQRVYGGKMRDVWSDSGFHDWRPPVSENILRNNGGFVLARLDLKREGDSWRVLRQELLPMTANTAPADSEIVAAIGKFAGPIAKADRVLAELPAAVGEADILQAYAAALTRIPGTQAVIYSPESVRSEWPAGELRASEVFNSLPWTNPLVQLPLTPEQLQSVQKNSALRVWIEDAAPGAPVTVTTSKYFATLLAAQLRLPAGALKETAEASEFAYFIRFLQEGGGSGVIAPLPAGWSLLPSVPAHE